MATPLPGDGEIPCSRDTGPSGNRSGTPASEHARSKTAPVVADGRPARAALAPPARPARRAASSSCVGSGGRRPAPAAGAHPFRGHPRFPGPAPCQPPARKPPSWDRSARTRMECRDRLLPGPSRGPLPRFGPPAGTSRARSDVPRAGRRVRRGLRRWSPAEAKVADRAPPAPEVRARHGGDRFPPGRRTACARHLGTATPGARRFTDGAGTPAPSTWKRSARKAPIPPPPAEPPPTSRARVAEPGRFRRMSTGGGGRPEPGSCAPGGARPFRRTLETPGGTTGFRGRLPTMAGPLHHSRSRRIRRDPDGHASSRDALPPAGRPPLRRRRSRPESARGPDETHAQPVPPVPGAGRCGRLAPRRRRSAGPQDRDAPGVIGIASSNPQGRGARPRATDPRCGLSRHVPPELSAHLRPVRSDHRLWRPSRPPSPTPSYGLLTRARYAADGGRGPAAHCRRSIFSTVRGG